MFAGGTSTGQMTKLKSISQVPSPYDKVPSNHKTNKIYNKKSQLFNLKKALNKIYEWNTLKLLQKLYLTLFTDCLRSVCPNPKLFKVADPKSYLKTNAGHKM